MKFMNDFDIDQAWQLYAIPARDHPVLGQAVRTIVSLRDAVNQCSDGWAYWPKPVRAASGLIELIMRDGTNAYHGGDRPDATEAELRKANRALKGFRTRHPFCKFRIYGPGGDLAPQEPNRVEYHLAGWKAGELAGKAGQVIPALAHVSQSEDGTTMIVTLVPGEVS